MTSSRWTTVFHGSMGEALVCRGLLESNEVPARILDENIKIIDPMITGANVFDVQLQVPELLATEARELLDYRPAPEEQSEPRDPAEERAYRLGLRIRWASILSLTAPYALWLARPYLAAVKSLGKKPRDHAWTIAALVYSTLVMLVAIQSLALLTYFSFAT